MTLWPGECVQQTNTARKHHCPPSVTAQLTACNKCPLYIAWLHHNLHAPYTQPHLVCHWLEERIQDGLLNLLLQNEANIDVCTRWAANRKRRAVSELSVREMPSVIPETLLSEHPKVLCRALNWSLRGGLCVMHNELSVSRGEHYQILISIHSFSDCLPHTWCWEWGLGMVIPPTWALPALAHDSPSVQYSHQSNTAASKLTSESDVLSPLLWVSWRRCDPGICPHQMSPLSQAT